MRAKTQREARDKLRAMQLANHQPVKIVSEMIGRTRMAITQDVYTHVSAAMRRSAADAVYAVIAPARVGGAQSSRTSPLPGQDVLPLDQ